MTIRRNGDGQTYSQPIDIRTAAQNLEEQGWELISATRAGNKEAVEGILKSGPISNIYLNPALKVAGKQQRQDIIEVIMKHANEHPYNEKSLPLGRAIILSPKKERRSESHNPEMVRIVAPITGVAIAAFGIYLASFFI